MIDIIKSSSTRIKTGLALIFVFLLMGYIDSLTLTWFLLGIVMILSFKESLMLFGIEDTRLYAVAIGTWTLGLVYPTPHELIFLVIILFASYLAFTRELDKKLFIPILYPLAPVLFLFSIYANFGIEYLLWLVVIVSGTDIGAYFVGKSFGKTSFCQTSPNKTMEGVLGGIVIAGIAGTLIAPEGINIFFAFIISLVTALSSIFGDLFESYLKREADVKDSGDILPGHGGMLDRSDGFLFAGIVMYILVKLFS